MGPRRAAGMGTVSVVAYSSFSDTTAARDWRTESHVQLDNYDDNETVNIGSFTTATRDSVTNGAVVIPRRRYLLRPVRRRSCCWEHRRQR